MRRRQTKPHPLHSFQFWFLILAAAGATAAWKLDLLPLASLQQKTSTDPVEVDLGAGSSQRRGFGDEGFSDVFENQAEPGAGGGEHSAAMPTGRAPGARAIPSVSPVTENPFGPASPEFVSAAGREPRPATAAARPITPSPEASPGTGPSGVVLAASSEVATGAPAPAGVTRADAAAPGETLDLTQIDAAMNAGTTDGDIAAHKALSELYWQRPALRSQFIGRIEQTARRIYFQPQPHYMEPCLIQPGDTLQAIARDYEVSWQYLERLNRMQADRMQAGRDIKVIKGPFAAVVDLSDHEITVHCHGHFVYRFPVGIGRDNATPAGTFVVEDKVVNPPYNGPEGAIAADDPANPIGERWISLGGGYGIHGTIEPDSIGGNDSRGCLRMHNSDVEIVYDLLTVGSEVVIQR